MIIEAFKRNVFTLSLTAIPDCDQYTNGVVYNSILDALNSSGMFDLISPQPLEEYQPYLSSAVESQCWQIGMFAEYDDRIARVVEQVTLSPQGTCMYIAISYWSP